MTEVNLIQFTSLFEIGFALHFAVAFIERIYSRELPVRIEQINARAKSLERLRQEISDAHKLSHSSDDKLILDLPRRIIENPVWMPRNEQVLDRFYALKQDTNGQIKLQKRILHIITFLSITVVLYSVVMLFLIGLNASFVNNLDVMTASALVLMQLLPLPLAACLFYFYARSTSHEIDRKIRGISELNLMLNETDDSAALGYSSVEHIYRRDLKKYGYQYQ